MVIIRRNPDGTIANPEQVKQQTQEQQQANEQVQQPVRTSHPALASKRGMQALQDAGSTTTFIQRNRYKDKQCKR